MGNQVKLPNPDISRFSDGIDKAAKAAVTFVQTHKVKILGTVLSLTTLDNIRLRRARKKEQEAYENSSEKQKQVALVHEAEINALKAEAEHAQEAIRRIDQLEQIVNNVTEEGGSK